MPGDAKRAMTIATINPAAVPVLDGAWTWQPPAVITGPTELTASMSATTFQSLSPSAKAMGELFDSANPAEC